MMPPKLYGWHHDYMKNLVKTGIVQYANIIEGACGVFQAEPIVNGIKYGPKTFFPSTWTEEKVIEKIFEVFENNKNKLPNPDSSGCYVIVDFTKCNLKIQMVFDPIKSMITTAFPTFK